MEPSQPRIYFKDDEVPEKPIFIKEAKKMNKIQFKFTGQVQGKNRETIADFFNKFKDDRIFKDNQTYREYKNSRKNESLKVPSKSVTIDQMNQNKNYLSKDKSLISNSMYFFRFFAFTKFMLT